MARVASYAVCTSLLLILFGCANQLAYTPTSSSMAVGEARQVAFRYLSGAKDWATYDHAIQVDNVRLRDDGLAILFRERHFEINLLSPAILSSNEVEYSSPTVSTCYFAGLEPRVISNVGASLGLWGVPVCNFWVLFDNPHDARSLADALYALKNRR